MSTSATENRQNSSKVQKAFRTPRSLSASQRASPLQPRRSAPVKLTYLQTALPRREGGISCSQMSSTAVSRCSSTFRLHAALTGSHLRAQGANDWFQSFGSVLKQQRRKLSGVKDEGIERLVSTVRDPLMDTAKAQWVADQLLEASENGVLVPANIVLDAYVRGKVRYLLRRHGTHTAIILSLSCMAVHYMKLMMRRYTARVRYLNGVVEFITRIALPTGLFGPLLAARLLL